METIAIIPARGGSKRFLRKNIASLGGNPLLSYPFSAAQKSMVFSRIFVSTEDQEIAEISKNLGAEIHNRENKFATDTAHELDACLDLLEDIEKNNEVMPEYICVIYPTAVFIEPDDFIKSKYMIDKNPDIEAIMCVSEFNYHPYKSLISKDEGYIEMLFPDKCKKRSQEYPHLVASNGTFYWLHVETLKNNREKSYYQDKLKSYEIPYDRAVDIDYLEDLNYAEMLMKTRKTNDI